MFCWLDNEILNNSIGDECWWHRPRTNYRIVVVDLPSKSGTLGEQLGLRENGQTDWVTYHYIRVNAHRKLSSARICPQAHDVSSENMLGGFSVSQIHTQNHSHKYASRCMWTSHFPVSENEG